jgi:uncharacterized protein (TIGR03382 family)
MMLLPLNLRSFSLLAIASALAGCAGAATSAAESTAPPTTGDASRAIAEADIVQLDGSRLYAMSKLGQLSVIDVSTDGKLALLGQLRLPGRPFEMYRRGTLLVAMSNGAIASDGRPIDPATSDTTWTAPDEGSGAMVIVLDVADPTHISTRAKSSVVGEIADSRIVGDVLYLATYENAACYGCGEKPRTLVTSFDISDPTAMTKADQASFESNAPDGYNLPWGSNWKRSIFVTDERLYIGGHADIDPNELYRGTSNEGIVDVLDIRDPTGRLATGARIIVAGAILSRWQIDEQNGILRVISQRGAGRTGNGLDMPAIDTFQIESTQSFTPLGHATIELVRQEGLRTVRFDTDRAYAITYNQTDPLFTIDLRNPAAPKVMGELKMPGFMFYLEPHGDRVIGLGIDRNDPMGSLNVSLFDVSDLAQPRMLARSSFGGASFSEDYEILNGELPEDQDRIQKAFHLYQDGLVAVPFASASGCEDTRSGVALVDWSSDTLIERALLPMPGNPRRTMEIGSQMLVVSDSNVRSFSLTPKDPVQTDDLTVGTCTGSAAYYPAYAEDGYPRGPYACDVAAGQKSQDVGGVLPLVLAALAIRFSRRRTVA